jgi:Arabinose efflux permease
MYRGRHLLTFGFLAVFLGNFGQSFYLGSYGASIQQALHLSATQYGFIYSLATLLAGSSLMLLGGRIDKMPLLRFVSLVAAGLFVASLLFLLASNVYGLLAAFFMVRLCGQGLLPHTGITTMARCFDSHRGKAISIAGSGVPVGEIVLPLLAAFSIATFGWQQSWLLVSLVIPLVFLPLTWWLLRAASAEGFDFSGGEEPANTETNKSPAAGRMQVLKDGRFWRVLPALLSAPFVVTGIFIHQAFVMQQMLWAPEWFALCFVVYGAVHWVSSIAMGFLVDRFSARKLLPFYNLPLVLSMVTVALLDGNFVAVLMLAFLGMAIGGSGPIGGALWAETYGTKSLGSIRSMVTSFGVWSTAISPILFGVLIDHGVTLTGLCWVLAAAVLLACISAAFSYRDEPGEVNRAS